MSQAHTSFWSSPLRYLSKKADRVVFPELGGATLFDVGKTLVRGLGNSRLQERAAAVTYNFFMAMPPTFLIMFSLLAYLPLKNVEPTLLNTIKLLSPNSNIYNNVHNIILDFINTRHQQALSYGVVLVLFFSSNGVRGLMRSFDTRSPDHIKKTSLQRRWTAIKLTLVIICVVIIGIATLIFQSRDLNPFIHREFRGFIHVKTVSFFILSLLVFFTISILYTFGPSLRHRFKFVSAGSLFATFGSVTVTSIFFFMVNHFINYNKFYGSVGTLIAFMVWIWLNTVIILLGYELNVSILLAKFSKQEDDVTPAKAIDL